MRAEDVPPYVELILPTIRAVSSLGQSAKAGEIKSKVTDDLEIGEDMLSVVYPNRPDQPVFLDRLDLGALLREADRRPGESFPRGFSHHRVGQEAASAAGGGSALKGSRS